MQISVACLMRLPALLCAAALFSIGLTDRVASGQERKINVIAFGAHPDDCDLGAGGTAAKYAARGRNRLSKTRRSQKSRTARIVVVTNQHVTESGVIHVRNTKHVRHVEKIEHFSNRFNGPTLSQLKDFRNSQIQ